LRNWHRFLGAVLFTTLLSVVARVPANALSKETFTYKQVRDLQIKPD
jgi:hypothetical protein